MEAAALCRLWGILLTRRTELWSFRVLCTVRAVNNSSRAVEAAGDSCTQNEQSYPEQQLLCQQLLFKNNSQIFPGLFLSVNLLLSDLFPFAKMLCNTLEQPVASYGCIYSRVGLSCSKLLHLWKTPELLWTHRQNRNAERARLDTRLQLCPSSPLLLHTLLDYFGCFKVEAGSLPRGNVRHGGNETFGKQEHRFTSYRMLLVFENKFCSAKAFSA